MLDKFLTSENVKVNGEIAGTFWEPCMVSELFLQLLQYFMANCESCIWILQIEWKLKFVFVCPETVQKLYSKNFEVGKFEFLWKLSLEKFGFTNSKESVPPEKKSQNWQKDKIYDDEKRARTFFILWSGKVIFFWGKVNFESLPGYFPLESWNKKISRALGQVSVIRISEYFCYLNISSSQYFLLMSIQYIYDPLCSWCRIHVLNPRVNF